MAPPLLYGHMVRLTLRQWQPGDEPFLWEMLYQAIHVADGELPPPRSILDDPSIAHYLTDFGSRDGDDAVIACDNLIPVGAAFCRRFTANDPSYGFISADVPEVGMAVVADRRGKGVGRALLMRLLDRHPTMSLNVDNDNVSARRLYESLGFVDLRADGTSVTMIRHAPRPVP
jgi:GNAT superfamily N-acetyltransferase